MSQLPGATFRLFPRQFPPLHRSCYFLFFIFGFLFESRVCYSLMTKFVLFLTMLFPPQPLSGGCSSILAKVCVRCMALTRFMLLPIICLDNITTLCGQFLGFSPSYKSPNSLWFFGIIYASIAQFSSFPFSKISSLLCTSLLLRCPPLAFSFFFFWFVIY
jgi:hypothetical protein